ncbi:MAG: T9SS type A sorting domain-containing protein [Saprospiraceae bacterium]|nr:T9SS type A sorting domain-containing protein [Saprospiraceae bacterium]
MTQLKTFLLFLFLCFTLQGFSITYSWGGGTGLWDNPNNWSPVGVPTFSDWVEIGIGTAIIPNYYDADAYIVTVYDSGNLIIRKHAELTLAGSVLTQMVIHGDVTNRGKIYSEPANGTPNNCIAIYGSGSLYQTSTGKLYLKDYLYKAIYIVGILDNQGLIDIDGENVGEQGIMTEFSGILNNTATGTILIDNTQDFGITLASTGTPFDNYGIIKIVSTTVNTAFNVFLSDFNNYNYLYINGGTSIGLDVFLDRTVTNTGKINISSTANTGKGMNVLGEFYNMSSGELLVQNSGELGIEIGWNGTLQNLGLVTISGSMGNIPLTVLNTLVNEGNINVIATNTTSPYFQIINYGFIENHSCGNISHNGKLYVINTGEVLNQGYWTSWNTGTDINLGFFENEGVLAYPYGSFNNVSVSNSGYKFEPISGAACLNSTIYDALVLGSNANQTVLNVYTDGKYNTIGGSYLASSNKLFANQEAVGLSILYFDMQNSTGCSYRMPLGFDIPIQGGVELCGDGIDNDCDGLIDESGCLAPSLNTEIGQVQQQKSPAFAPDSFDIFPNPSHGNFQIQTGQAVGEINTIYLLNAGGQVIWKGLNTNLIPEIPAGLYWVRIETNTGFLPAQKWIKL